jgi:hypothetical protein
MSKYILKRDLPFAKAGSEVIEETSILDQTLVKKFAVKATTKHSGITRNTCAVRTIKNRI